MAFGFAAANAIFSPLAYWLINPKGRRFLLLISLLAMVPLLIATAFSVKIESNKPAEARRARHGVTALFLILYTAAYSPGAGVIPFMYASEAFPLVNREAGVLSAAL